jgi:hypothetical protein
MPCNQASAPLQHSHTQFHTCKYTWSQHNLMCIDHNKITRRCAVIPQQAPYTVKPDACARCWPALNICLHKHTSTLLTCTSRCLPASLATGAPCLTPAVLLGRVLPTAPPFEHHLACNLNLQGRRVAAQLQVQLLGMTKETQKCTITQALITLFICSRAIEHPVILQYTRAKIAGFVHKFRWGNERA